MIPKVIHLCWLSDNPMPDNLQRYIETWKSVLPDYEIKLWDFKRFPKSKSEWVSEAFDAKKYAFAADYIRNYALYTEGGIYFDADVEVLKSFDSLLHLPYFFGFENSSGCIDAGVMGSEPGNPLFGEMLKYYEGKHFVNPDGTINNTPLPFLLRDILGKKWKIKPVESPECFDSSDDVISVLPYDYFSPIHIETKRLEKTGNTMAIHHFAASWVTGWHKHKRTLKKIVGPSITQFLIKTKRTLFGTKK